MPFLRGVRCRTIFLNVAAAAKADDLIEHGAGLPLQSDLARTVAVGTITLESLVAVPR